MVPLRSEYGTDTSHTADCQYRSPRLVLYDIDRDPLPAATEKASRKARKYRLGWDTVALAVGVIAAFAFLLVSFANFLWTSAADHSARGTVSPVIAKRVAPGDTLWHYASQYGDPNTYILDRVETIAQENHLRPNSTLVPGQVIHIPVRNPYLAAHFAQRPSRMAALPRS